MAQPELTFFCELDGPSLQILFSQADIIQKIKELGASISLGIQDFSRERADVVRMLNEEGIPVTAWLLLPKEEGYWFNLYNSPQAVSRYGQFKLWSAHNLLSWAGIGLDIEPDLKVIEQFLAKPQKTLIRYGPRIFARQKYRHALIDYQSLVAMIRSDGYFVESYQFPIILDERKAGSTILQKVTGLVDIHVDREVLMLYSSFTRGYGPGLLWNYGRDVQAIGIGSTGGGVNLGQGRIDTRPLDWEELERDLLLASQLTDQIYIFSLEGCVRQSFLQKIADLDWNQGIIPPVHISNRVGQYRRLSRAFLWIVSHPIWIFATITGIAWLLLRKKRKPPNR